MKKIMILAVFVLMGASSVSAQRGGGRQENAQMSREQMRTERDNLDKQVSALLTDTQKKKYEEMKKSRRGGGRRKNK